jgi:glycosyltransferase involved in cell wall biosynthesis
MAGLQGAGPHQPPPTSLIVCSRNRLEFLLDCVESILGGEELPTELIIVDDSDCENTALANFTTDLPCEVRYVWRRRRGLSSAVNFALEAARHDVLVFCQDDNRVESSWFGAITRALVAAGPRVLVTGQVQADDTEEPGGFVANANAGRERIVYRGRLRRDVLYVQNMAMFKSAAAEIGPFDERLGPGTPFPGCEDSDFAFRALEAGYSIVYEPAAIVSHRAWRREGGYLRFRWGYGFARGGLYGKYLSLRDPHMLRRLWRDIRMHLAPVPVLLAGDRQKGFGHLAFSGGIVAGAIWWTLTERHPASRLRPRSS